jgi:hypothetical protein
MRNSLLFRFDNGYHTTTIFARLSDLLRFRCSGDIAFQIHLVGFTLHLIFRMIFSFNLHLKFSIEF